MNFHAAAPKIPPRILCIGMPVRDLTFRVAGVPARGSKENATHFDEICGGNALNARDRNRAPRRTRLDLRTDGRCPGNFQPLYLRRARRMKASTPNISSICRAW